MSTVALEARAASTAQRERWADTAKGACILLVVLWHVIMKHYLQISWHLPVPIPGAWGHLGEQLLPLRMPLFFTISGMFAAGAVARRWRVVARTKVAKFLYLYALWLLVHTTVLAFVPGFQTARAHSVLDLVEQLTITPSNLWYLFALALYFVVAKLTRRVPKAVMLTLALALSTVTAAGWLATPGDRGGLMQNLVFFLGGLYFRPGIERLAASANRRRLMLFGLAYAVLLGDMAVAGAQAWPGVWPVVSAGAVVFGVTAAAQIAKSDLVAGALSSIGRRTLPVYVMHMPVLAILHGLLIRPLSAYISDQPVLAMVEPLSMTGLVVAICLLLHRGMRRAGWLFDLPKTTRKPARPATREPEREPEPFRGVARVATRGVARVSASEPVGVAAGEPVGVAAGEPVGVAAGEPVGVAGREPVGVAATSATALYRSSPD